jgi:hypothetical protein
VSTTLGVYSHVVPDLQEAAARRFEEGLESTSTEKQSTVVLQITVGNFVFGGQLGVEFEARRGVRAVYGGGLENRCSDFQGRGFESHPLRHESSRRG